jgi:hypothetical protein
MLAARVFLLAAARDDFQASRARAVGSRSIMLWRPKTCQSLWAGATLTAQLFLDPLPGSSRGEERDIIDSRFFASRYISFLLNWSAKYSACRIASATMVRVGFSAPPLVNWLPSEMNRFGMSWVWP